MHLSALTAVLFDRGSVLDGGLIQQGLTLILAACLIRFFYNRFIFQVPQRPFSSIRDFFLKSLGQIPPVEEVEVVAPIPQLLSSRQRMRYPKNNVRPTKREKKAPASISFQGPRIKQPYEVFLVLDIEGTCDLGTNFNYPNEIIVRADDILEKHYHFQ